MKTIRVATGDRPYDVLLAPGLIDRSAELLAPFARGGRVVVVSDENVWGLHGARLTAALAAGGIAAVPLTVPPGEGSKSWPTLTGLLDRLLALELGRQDHVIAFGGGVIGDLAGFAASVLKRGCGYIQMPTTLLAQVDSSVGGKTAINVAAGKNLVGTFHQPALVIVDPSLLDTLPVRDLRAGYAEVVKYGLIVDAPFFAWCESHGAQVQAGDPLARAHAIATSIAAKAAIVAGDEYETKGQRALLNLGHTFGHALEAEAGFGDALLHGEAVATGMVLAFRFSAERQLCSAADADRVEAHLAASGLPTRFDADPDRMIDHMRQDKKASGGTIPFILARGIGQAFVERGASLDEVRGFLMRARAK